MRALVTVLLLLPCTTAVAYDAQQTPIHNSSDLLEWCRVESEADFVAQGKTPYNWTARHFERGNTLRVEGHWRVDGKRQRIDCRVARGAQREHATRRTTAE